MIYMSTLVLSMFITIALIPMLKELAGKYLALDYPGGRKIHHRPIPKSGGISMMLGALVPILLWIPGNSFVVSILIGSWIIAIFGLIDDLKDLSYRIKFLGQVAAAAVVIVYGGVKITFIGNLLPGVSSLPDIAAIPLTVLVIVGVTNAINLSDGLDGLAGGISLLSFICIGYLAFIDGNRGIVIVCTAMIGAIIGFLRFNTHPASVFMGDTGSQLLGFLGITLSLNLTQNDISLTPVLPLLILGVPIMDTLRVMGDRMLDGKKPFEADTRHLHHRLMKMGLFHTEAVLTIYCLHAALVTLAFVFRHHSDWFLLLIYLFFSLSIILGLLVAGRLGWHRQKYNFFDGILKTRLRGLKQSNVFIKIIFKLLEIGIPLLLLVTCFISSAVPLLVSLIAIFFVGVLIVIRIYKPRWTTIALKLAIYLQIPLIIYQSEINPVAWAELSLVRVYNIFFVVMAIVIVLVLKFTRRRSGFKSTPMDFLILFIALVIPNIPDAQIRSYQMGIITAKIISIYYGYEVLIGELRKDDKPLSHITIFTLLFIGGRGFLGI